MKGVVVHALAIVIGGGAVAASPALAQRLACAAIRPGETATRVAGRITGNAESIYEPWFQIVDSTSSRFIAKAQYDHVRPGWLACVVNEPATRSARPVLAGMPGAVWMDAASRRVLRTIGQLDFAFVSAALVVALLLAWSSIEAYLTDRQRMLEAMQRFGETFVREFERPLVQPGAPGRPIQSRLRASPRRRQLDILLAPGGGRRYPNLSDHRKNLEYDVTRVLQLLRDHPFVRSSLHTHGRWVVVPFEFRNSSTQAGAK